MMMHNEKHIRVAGFGGQGVMMFGQILAYAATFKNQNTLWFPSYGPETRGGTANCQVIVSDQDINSPVFNQADYLIVFNHPSLDKFESKMHDEGIIFYNASIIKDEVKHDKVQVYGIPVNDIAIKLGNQQVANMVMLGAFLEVTHMFEQEVIEKALTKFLGIKKEKMIDINLDAISQGRNYMKQLNH